MGAEKAVGRYPQPRLHFAPTTAVCCSPQTRSFDPADTLLGTCHAPSPCYEVRAAALAAGFPEETPVEAVNRLCGSGLMAIRHVSDSIRAGDIDVGVAVGYESMSSK